MRKNTWYAVYHQQELEYLARSYQPGYVFMLFMGRKPLTEYLPIDGSKPMTGNLIINVALPSYDQIVGKAVRIKMHPTAGVVYFRNFADSTYASIVAGSCNFTSISGLTTASLIQTRAIDNSSIIFNARDNDTALMVECARLLSGSIPKLDLYHIGGGNLPLADPADGSKRLWNDGGTVKVGT